MGGLVEFQRVTYRRKGRALLEDVSLEVDRGEFLAILGQNGAGKSTLARLAIGEEAPTSGRVRHVPALRTGYVPQLVHRDPALPLTVRAFLALGKGAARDQALEMTGGEALLDRAVADLSGGEMRRIVLARALMREPDLLLLDEPLAGVDAASQGNLYKALKRHQRERGCGLVLIAHEVITVLSIADRVILLDGHIAAEGSPAEIVRSDALARLFGVSLAKVAQLELARVSGEGHG